MKKSFQILSNRDIKSIHSIGARSIPKVQRSGYLELYMLKRENDRLMNEIFMLDKRKNSVARQLKSITHRMALLNKEAEIKQKPIKHGKNISPNTYKTMSMDY